MVSTLREYLLVFVKINSNFDIFFMATKMCIKLLVYQCDYKWEASCFYLVIDDLSNFQKAYKEMGLDLKEIGLHTS